MASLRKRLLLFSSFGLHISRYRPFCTIGHELALCKGCGAKLQTLDPEKRGYAILPKEKPLNYTPKWVLVERLETERARRENLSNNNNDTPSPIETYKNAMDPVIKIHDGPPKKPKRRIEKIVCVRCHQLTFQGRTRSGKDIDLTDFRKELESIVYTHQKSGFVLIIDVFDFYGTALKDLGKTLGPNNPVIIIVNKIDILPERNSTTRLNKWIINEIKENYLLNIKDVIIASGISGMNIINIYDAIISLDKACDDIFIVGTTNVGKSTLVNKMKQKGYISDKGYNNTSTTSIFPGTTLGVMHYNLVTKNRFKNLYDTPGIVNSKQLSCLLEFDELKAVNPKKKLKPLTYRLKTNYSLLLGAGLGEIRLLSGRDIYVTIFISSFVSIHITKIEKVDNLLSKHVGNLLYPPFTKERLNALGSRQSEVKSFVGKGWNESVADIVFSGLGWVALTSCGEFSVEIRGAKDYETAVREPPLLPFESFKSYKKFTGVAKRT